MENEHTFCHSLEQVRNLVEIAKAEERELCARTASPIIQYPRGHFLSCEDPLDCCTCGFKVSEKIAQAIRQRSSNE